MTCGNCKHYEPARNPETGRLLPSQAGQCTYQVVWPETPTSYDVMDKWGRCGSFSPPLPQSVRSDDGSRCKMFEDKKPVPKLWQKSERLI